MNVSLTLYFNFIHKYTPNMTFEFANLWIRWTAFCLTHFFAISGIVFGIYSTRKYYRESTLPSKLKWLSICVNITLILFCILITLVWNIGSACLINDRYTYDTLATATSNAALFCRMFGILVLYFLFCYRITIVLGSTAFEPSKCFKIFGLVLPGIIMSLAAIGVVIASIISSNRRIAGGFNVVFVLIFQISSIYLIIFLIKKLYIIVHLSIKLSKFATDLVTHQATLNLNNHKNNKVAQKQKQVQQLHQPSQPQMQAQHVQSVAVPQLQQMQVHVQVSSQSHLDSIATNHDHDHDSNVNIGLTDLTTVVTNALISLNDDNISGININNISVVSDSHAQWSLFDKNLIDSLKILKTMITLCVCICVTSVTNLISIVIFGLYASGKFNSQQLQPMLPRRLRNS